MPGAMEIAAYRPLDESRRKPLLELVRMHNTTLRVEGLITERGGKHGTCRRADEVLLLVLQS